MHPKGPGRPENYFFWPTREDSCYIPATEILCKISAPIPTSKSARKCICLILIHNLLKKKIVEKELNGVYMYVTLAYKFYCSSASL